jgi:hypothetical protein
LTEAYDRFIPDAFESKTFSHGRSFPTIGWGIWVLNGAGEKSGERIVKKRIFSTSVCPAGVIFCDAIIL